MKDIHYEEIMAKQHLNVLCYMRGIQAFNENEIEKVKKIFSVDIRCQ